MGTCQLCHKRSPLIAQTLGLCLDCIRKTPGPALEIAFDVHARNRKNLGLPSLPPDTESGLLCRLCVNACKIGEKEIGYCGLRENVHGKLEGGRRDVGKLSWYHDPLPTNCVADWVCPEGAACSNPKNTSVAGSGIDRTNLAVFFHACSFNCLYCQNWHFREETRRFGNQTAEQLVDAVDDDTACICYFGGDPTPQVLFALEAAHRARQQKPEASLRICWETNGSMASGILDRVMDLTIASDGCVKFDLKAWNEDVHKALTGVTNRRTLENFARAARWINRRPDPQPLIAATLLVPGYIDAAEVRALADFIAMLNPKIPYALLGFHPQFAMTDLPVTSRTQAEACLEAARDAGLTNVRLGNEHLLSE